jgi:hypothetical protein
MTSIRLNRSLLRAAAGVSLAAAMAVVLSAWVLRAGPPKDLDYSRTRVSEAGLYRAMIRPDGDSIPTGRLHRWTLHLETASGAPVDSATISISGGMPEHGHGLPTKPRVTSDIGHGDHLVDGMKFNMGGWWIVQFRVAGAAGSDAVVFNLKL